MSKTRKIARYEILEEKGHGAMGAVYVARDPAMDRIVALKTIHTHALSGPQGHEYRERFFREARAAGRLAHPGIVQMFDVGEDEGNPFLVMEFVEGQTLSDLAKGGERFTLDRTCEVGQQIAEALGYAHCHGVVHRDIKPANILMTSKTKYGIERPKITDFGVAKLSATQITSTGQMLGTPAFMPPEQFTGAAIDGRSDLFSLGVILYWLSTGELAFPGETITAVSYKVVHTEPVPPRKLNPAIPAVLEQIIAKCLLKDPAERYQTGEELAHDLAVLREGRTGAAMAKSPAIKAGTGSGKEMEVTLDTRPVPEVEAEAEEAAPAAAMKSHGPGAAVAGPPSVARPLKKTGSNPIAAVGIAAAFVLVAGGWWLVHKARSKGHEAQATMTVVAANAPKPPTTTPATATNAAQPATSKPDASSAPTGASPDVKKPAANDAAAHATAPPKKTLKPAKPVEKANAAAKPAALPVGPPASAATPVVMPAPEPPKPAPPAKVAFDPKAMDSNANGKLRMDASHFPMNVDFTVEMDGKVYFERGAAKTQTKFEDYFVPPGIHEFRVLAGTGENRKSSNIVSMEFAPKKRKTLQIELRSKGMGEKAAVPQDVYADSQIVVILK
jgi:eukaryotic-like serine/threonine-protein kinase